jgi:chemotaxis protein CheX
MDTSIVTAFAQSAKGTFKDMFGLAAVDAGARELSGSEDHGWDITGLVGLAGQAQGVVALRLSHALLPSLLASTGVAAGTDDAKQLEGGLVGEMINIIAGQAISAIRDINIDIAPPVIVRGPNHKIGWPAIAPVVALSFTLPSGSFELDLCIRH